MKLSEIIDNLEAIVTALKLGNDSGQAVGQDSLYNKDSYKNKEVSKESTKKDSYIGSSSPTATLPTTVVAHSRGARLPETWTLGPQGLHYATTKGLSAADAHHEAEKFKSHFLAASGQQAIKRDWLQAWQVWVLNALNKYGIKPAHSLPTETLPTLSDERRAELAAKYSKRTE